MKHQLFSKLFFLLVLSMLFLLFTACGGEPGATATVTEKAGAASELPSTVLTSQSPSTAPTGASTTLAAETECPCGETAADATTALSSSTASGTGSTGSFVVGAQDAAFQLECQEEKGYFVVREKKVYTGEYSESHIWRIKVLSPNEALRSAVQSIIDEKMANANNKWLEFEEKAKEKLAKQGNGGFNLLQELQVEDYDGLYIVYATMKHGIWSGEFVRPEYFILYLDKQSGQSYSMDRIFERWQLKDSEISEKINQFMADNPEYKGYSVGPSDITPDTTFILKDKIIFIFRTGEAEQAVPALIELPRN